MKTRKLKITGMPSEREYNALPFGRQLEFAQKLKEFKVTAKVTHLSQKRQTYQKAIKEAISLYGVKEYWCEFYNEPHCKDDSFEFWYK
jgi:hypothetical protein